MSEVMRRERSGVAGGLILIGITESAQQVLLLVSDPPQGGVTSPPTHPVGSSSAST